MDFIIDHLAKDSGNDIFRPVFFRLQEADQLDAFKQLLKADPCITIHDELEGQLRELIKSLHPSLRIKAQEYPALIEEHLDGIDPYVYGVWVYYPWSKKVVHLLDESEFIEIRTNRNRYKITREEQRYLQQKKIGIVGLSVGQSIALTLAMERTCGELRLADFDTAELSNLNRIRTGVQNLGLRKTVIAAREIAEIDPYLCVKIFNDGLTNENIDEFFTEDGKLDILVEVCDGLDIKIISRFKARELQIPVVMDTNDRGMLDIERFDLDPQRPVLHGLAEGLDPQSIKDLTNEEKIPYILKMVGAEQISTRLKASMIEVEQSINTWPQLASSVVLGGAISTDVCRRILLDQLHVSGRYYIDIEDYVKDAASGETQVPENYLPPAPLQDEEWLRLAKNYTVTTASVSLTNDEAKTIVDAATWAPSGGNAQPWKFVYTDGRLFVFHDIHASYSFLDYNSFGAYVAIGAALENLCIKSRAIGFEPLVDITPVETSRPLIAVVSFKKLEMPVHSALEQGIAIRLTNRNIAQRIALEGTFYDHLKASLNDYDATLEIVDDAAMMQELGDILAGTERLVLMHPRGHYDAFNKELRWTEEENLQKRDGIDVATLGISKGEVSAFRIANDSGAISFLRDTVRGGTAFKKMAHKAVAAASALGIITMPAYSEKNFLLGGMALERAWLEANLKGVSVQPISQFTFLMARLVHGNGQEFDSFYQNEFLSLRSRFLKLLPKFDDRIPVFIFRLCMADEPRIKSLRKNIDSVFIYN